MGPTMAVIYEISELLTFYFDIIILLTLSYELKSVSPPPPLRDDVRGKKSVLENHIINNREF